LSYTRHPMAGVVFSFLANSLPEYCNCGACDHATQALRQAKMVSLQQDKCSCEILGNGRAVYQPYAYCMSCANFDETQPICSWCAARCHAGHTLQSAPADTVACQCGLKKHRCLSSEELEEQKKRKQEFVEDLLRLCAQAIISERVPVWRRQYFRNSRAEHASEIARPVAGENESDWSDWRTHRLAGEAQLSRKVARAFGRFFETGALGQGIFDRLAELVLKESKGECMLRRSNDDVVGMGEIYCCDLCWPKSDRPPKSFFIMQEPPHLHFL